MSRNVLIPVSRFSVDYTLACGRPYSDLERFVLKALDEGVRTLGELVEVLALPTRVVAEGLVTLIHADWVAHTDNGFAPTREGQEAARSGAALRGRNLRAEHATVFVERVLGSTVLPEGMYAHPWRQLKEDGLTRDAVALRDDKVVLEPDHAVLAKLLPRRAGGQWLSQIDNVRLRSRREYLLAHVRPDTGEVLGLSNQLTALMRDHLIDAVARFGDRDAPVPTGLVRWSADPVPVVPVRSSGGVAVSVRPGDVLVGPAEHGRVLPDVARQVHTSLLILSPSGRTEALQSIRPLFESLVDRGIDVDLVCAEPESGAEALLASLARDGGARDASLRVKHAPGQRGSLLLWDTAEGPVAVIGAHDWLGQDDQGPAQVSLLLREPQLLMELCWFVEGILRRGAVSHPSAVRWRSLAERASALPPRGEGGAEAELVLGEASSVVAERLRRRARERLFYVSPYPAPHGQADEAFVLVQQAESFLVVADDECLVGRWPRQAAIETGGGLCLLLRSADLANRLAARLSVT